MGCLRTRRRLATVRLAARATARRCAGRRWR
jgi:hypothetical protein